MRDRAFDLGADAVPGSDPVVEAFKRDVDRTLLRENLRLTPDERILKVQDFIKFTTAVREAGRRARQ